MTRGISSGTAHFVVAMLMLSAVAWLAGCTFDRSMLDSQACTTDDDCPGGVCQLGYCVDGAREEPCDGACSDLEVCDEETNTCQCVGTGDGEPTTCGDGELCCAGGCLAIDSDVANCGGCGVACGPEETCSDGFCVCGDTSKQGGAACDSPRVCCNGACTNPEFDAACCGDAQQNCGTRACIGGDCQCAPGTDTCGPEECGTNTLTDPVHCGQCNLNPTSMEPPACEQGQECFGGQCSCDGSLCADGEECCNGTLCLSNVDKLTDRRNCGACGNACRPNYTCESGQCLCNGMECAAGEVCCGSLDSRTCVPENECLCNGDPCLNECCPGSPDTCVDLTMDPLNCGECGTTCGAGQSCTNGVCTCDNDNLVVCDGACVDRLIDSDNCGACGVSCTGGDVCCGGECVDIETEIGNCGGCGAFCNGDECDAGDCLCNGQAVDLTSDVANCGSCETSCQRPHVTGVACTNSACAFGAATCEAGWGNCVADIATDGCETFLLDDEANCGMCGNACPAGQSCAAGACVEVDIVVEVEVGQNLACARRASGTVECWGKNDKGQLGNGSTNDSHVPVEVPGLIAVDLAVGSNHVCAATQSGEVRCWGNSTEGETGIDADQVKTPNLVPLTGLASQVAAGQDHSCAIVDRSADGGAVGEVWCWGKGDQGRLGHDSTSDSAAPVRAVGLTNVIEIDAGEKHNCALKSDGTVWCWGDDVDGRTGDGGGNGNNDIRVPTQIDLSMPPQFAHVAVGWKSSYALDTNNRVWGWGLNEDSNLLAEGGESVREIASGYLEIDAGRKTVCGITPATRVQCWGQNNEGQAGIGSKGDPVTTRSDVVTLQSGIVDVSVGWESACAVLDTGSVTCWGKDVDGILGNGPDGNQLMPGPVVGLP